MLRPLRQWSDADFVDHTAGNEGSVALADKAFAAGGCCDGGFARKNVVGAAGSCDPAVARARAWKLGDWRNGRGAWARVLYRGAGGLSAAKGLSEAGRVPLIAVSRLALLAASVDGGGGSVHAVLDAGRGEFYYGEYVGRRCVREALLSKKDVMAATIRAALSSCARRRWGRRWQGSRVAVGGRAFRRAALPFALDRIARQRL